MSTALRRMRRFRSALGTICRRGRLLLRRPVKRQRLDDVRVSGGRRHSNGACDAGKLEGNGEYMTADECPESGDRHSGKPENWQTGILAGVCDESSSHSIPAVRCAGGMIAGYL
jgi:hypothetical protein